MHALFRISEFLKYQLRAGNEHHIHSPFVYDLYTNGIKDETPFYAFSKIESIRSLMKLSKERISVHDFGTGGAEGKSRILSKSSIVRNYVKPEKSGQLLFRLVNYFHPGQILEIGTSLGITTLYLASAYGKSRVITLEGCPNTASAAAKNFELAGTKNIEIINGEFEKSLPKALARCKTLDFVYFDGNHRMEPTLKYFNECLAYHHENSVFVFDDIYWSKDMAQAWNKIKSHPAVTTVIDLYSMGIIFFRLNQAKQEFTLRF